MLLNPPVITKELHNLKSLCERCCRNEINAYTPEGRKERELLLQEIQQECDIKYNTGKNRYTLIPRMSKEEIKQYKRTQQKTQQGKMIFISEEQQEVDIADNTVFINCGLDDLIIYYAYHYECEFKNQLITCLLHNTELYRLYNKYDNELESLLQQYPVSLIKKAEELIGDSLYRLISDSLKRLNKQHKIDMDEYYIIHNQTVPTYALKDVIEKACKEMKCSNEREAIKLDRQKYYNIRDRILQEFLRKKSENLSKLYVPGTDIEDYTIDYKHIKFYSATRYSNELTKERQEEIFSAFMGRFRERLKYHINSGKKKAYRKTKRNSVSNSILAQDCFNTFEKYLKLSSMGYHTPQEYHDKGFQWNYDLGRVSGIEIEV